MFSRSVKIKNMTNLRQITTSIIYLEKRQQLEDVFKKNEKMCRITNNSGGYVIFPLKQRIPVRAESERMDIHYLQCRGGREDYLTPAGSAGIQHFADIKIHLSAVDQSLARVSISTLWQMFSIHHPSLSVTHP